MFAFGETKASVVNGKLILPDKFHLKNKRLFGKWKDLSTLIVSDNVNSVNYAVRKEKKLLYLYLDGDNKISVPHKYENYTVEIRGSITTIELNFFISNEERFSMLT